MNKLGLPRGRDRKAVAMYGRENFLVTFSFRLNRIDLFLSLENFYFGKIYITSIIFQFCPSVKFHRAPYGGMLRRCYSLRNTDRKRTI